MVAAALYSGRPSDRRRADGTRDVGLVRRIPEVTACRRYEGSAEAGLAPKHMFGIISPEARCRCAGGIVTPSDS
ncbi:hypothetical protein GCM10023196_075780 [Actinoallomurus vinaceus]|uniref:Uncharacterized protein n=1 Tax=Actinoallomurus vinaceus TaxID=1080074 RepID=A0ABP8UNR4_9ACTN